MKEKKIYEGWLVAAKILSIDPSGQALCPVCTRAYLTIQDVRVKNSSLLERYMRCPACLSFNVLKMTTQSAVDVSNIPFTTFGD
jgi:hypothetical protein